MDGHRQHWPILPLPITALLGLMPTLTSIFIGMIPTLIESAVALFTALVTVVPTILPRLIPALLELAPRIVGTIVGLIPQLIGAGVDLIGGLVKGLWDAAASVGTALLDIAQDAIGDFLGFLGIHSPSRLFAGYGLNLVQGFAGGLDCSRGMFAKSLDGLAGMAADFSSDPLTMAPAGALTAQTVRSTPVHTAQPIGPAVVDLSAASAQLFARLIADGLTMILPVPGWWARLARIMSRTLRKALLELVQVFSHTRSNVEVLVKVGVQLFAQTRI